MAIIGQLVYNLEDYDNSGELISSTDSSSPSILANSQFETSTAATKLQIYENFFRTNGPLQGLQISKLGIQAEPGTKIKIGTASENEATAYDVIIGRNGIYELEDEQVRVKYLKFVQQYEWMLDKTATNAKLNQGRAYLLGANAIFNQIFNNLLNATEYYVFTEDYNNANKFLVYNPDLEHKYEIINADSLNDDQVILSAYQTQSFGQITDYWLKYDLVFDTYLRDYERAYGEYSQGINGVYINQWPEGTPGREEDGRLPVVLKNVIIDYIGETSASNNTKKED